MSERGHEFAAALAARFTPPPPGLTVWTSTLRRTIQTASFLRLPTTEWRQLDEIDAGVCDGMTYDEMEQRMPEDFRQRRADKLRYRFPQGESYLDVIHRVEALILELERQTAPTLVVGHQAVLRTIYAYLVGSPIEDCPHLSLPLHTLIELTPNAYGCDERRTALTRAIDDRLSIIPGPVRY